MTPEPATNLLTADDHRTMLEYMGHVRRLGRLAVIQLVGTVLLLVAVAAIQWQIVQRNRTIDRVDRSAAAGEAVARRGTELVESVVGTPEQLKASLAAAQAQREAVARIEAELAEVRAELRTALAAPPPA